VCRETCCRVRMLILIRRSRLFGGEATNCIEMESSDKSPFTLLGYERRMRIFPISRIFLRVANVNYK